MVKLIAILVCLLVAAPACSQERPQSDEAAIAEKLSTLAGASAQACGLIKRGGPLKQGWKCAQVADQKHKPFWLAVEGQRTDSAVWHVIARSTSGARYVIFYTSNEFGQREFKPSFTITPCDEPFQIFKNELFTLRCGPDVP